MVITRWGRMVDVAENFMHNSSGMALICNDDIPGTHDDNTGFEDLYASAIADIETVQVVMPLMTLALEVTQILTCADTPTAGLVLLIHNRIK